MDDRTPLIDALHSPARLYRRDLDGHHRPVGPMIEVICGRCVEPPGRRGMTYVVLASGSGAMVRDRLVGAGPSIRLEYGVPFGSTRQARIDFDLDALAYLDYDVAKAIAWLRSHDLWMGRRVRAV